MSEIAVIINKSHEAYAIRSVSKHVKRTWPALEAHWIQGLGDVMRTALLLVVVCFTLCGSQAQAPVTTTETFTLTMHVLGSEISFSVEDKDLEGSPEWLNPDSDPPPFAIAEAVRISRTELNRYVDNLEEWRVSSVELRRFERRALWFYVVEWRPRKPGHVGDGVNIPILMNGRAAVGKIRPDPDSKRNN